MLYFKEKNVIYLADRYYGSIELFSILESYGFHYCVRGKKNFFKKYISQMKSNDEWIEIKLDKAWLKRLKYERSKERLSDTPSFRIRIVKSTYDYTDKHGHIHIVIFYSLLTLIRIYSTLMKLLNYMQSAGILNVPIKH